MRQRQRVMRKWIWRRVGATLFILVAGVLLVRGAWGILAEFRLHRVQRQLIAAGGVDRLGPSAPAAGPSEIVMLARDFRPMTFRSLGFTGQTVLPPLLDAPFSPLEKDKLLAVIAANDPVFARLDHTPVPPSPWEVPFGEKSVGESTLGDQFRLMMDLCVARAMMEHTDGQDDAAVKSLRRAMALDRLVVMHRSLAAHQLVMYLRARIVAVMERIGQDLKIDAGNMRSEPGAATVEEVRGLIADLMGDTAFHQQVALGCREQIRALAGISPALDERPDLLKENSVRRLTWLVRPVLVDEQRRALEKARRWLKVVEADSYEQYRQDPWEINDVRLSQGVMSATNSFDIQWFRLSFGHFRAIADARAAAVLLAARWYELEHAAPTMMGEKLIPQYLPAPAVDPFAADGRPLRYRLESSGGRSVWSVGANGTDDAATISAVARGRSWEQPDLVYGEAWFIARGIYPTSTTPATSAVPATTTTAPTK